MPVIQNTNVTEALERRESQIWLLRHFVAQKATVITKIIYSKNLQNLFIREVLLWQQCVTVSHDMRVIECRFKH